MDDAPKSAYELAMERLRKKDQEAGISETALTAGQKDEIAEIRRVYDARLAQDDILHRSALMKTFDPAEREKLEEENRRERARLADERDAKIERVRRGAARP